MATMVESVSGPLLTINTGSSSLKAALYAPDRWQQRELGVQVERIGGAGSRLRITNAHGATVWEAQRELADHEAALQAFLDWLEREHPDRPPAAVGHRVVHGGAKYHAPQVVTADLVAALQALVTIDPEHLPQAIAAIRAVSRRYPAVPQVACFDTAFHRTMPDVAQRYPLPRSLWEAGVLRYGFHGLSYEYVVQELRTLDPAAATGRLVLAHLGNGASMAAVRNGISVDTTMGFTPTGGLMMGTRSGDLDPGVLLYLLQARSMAPEAVSTLVNRQAGLLGVSGTSGDMRELLDREPSDPAAAEAVALYCYQARKFLGALVAVLGGLDTLVFTGGIGEHAAPIRQRICADLAFLGLQLAPQRNARHAPIISGDQSAVTVRVIPTDEDTMIARHAYRLLRQEGIDHVSV
jgi:acetate kinase